MTAALATLAALALTLAIVPPSAGAEPAPAGQIEVLEVAHDPAGTITATIASSDRDFDPARLTAFVDGLPVAIRVLETRRRPPAAVLLAIDTSGSMEGSALLAAQDAARRLVDRLPIDDRVALVSFAGWPLVLSDFTTDRAITLGGLDVLTAVGETALFDTVALATDMLSGQPADGPRVLVLLSDGRDSGWAPAERAASTVEAVAASGIEVHAFGLGADVDTEYLSRLAAVSGGAHYAIADEQSLGTVFGALGTRLGDQYTIAVPVPPLSTGEHVLSLRAAAGDPGLEAAFAVSNRGLFTAQVAERKSTEADAPLVINVTSTVPGSTLAFEAELDGVALPVVDGRVYIDPWLVASGDHTVVVSAIVAGAVAATQDVAVTVPALDPLVTTALSDRHLEVSARVQAAAAPLIVVRDARTPDAPPLAHATGERLVTELPETAGPLLIEVRGTGDVVARRELEGPPPVAQSEPASGVPPVVPIAVALLLAVAAAAIGVTRVRSRRAHSAIRVRARRLGTGEHTSPPPPSDLGTVTVRGPDGEERSFPVGPRPLTIGRSPTCDIVLDDASVRPVHSRISGRRRGEYQVHGLRPGAHADRSPIDNWTLLHSGESIMVGEHVLTVADRATGTERTASERMLPERETAEPGFAEPGLAS